MDYKIIMEINDFVKANEFEWYDRHIMYIPEGLMYLYENEKYDDIKLTIRNFVNLIKKYYVELYETELIMRLNNII